MSSSVTKLSPIYIPVSLSETLSDRSCRHATHCMLYSTPDPNGISYVLFQLRFDGFVGFCGGGVDVENVTIDHIMEAMNRELNEEINYIFESVVQSEWICSHRNTDSVGSPFVQHFFAKELSFQQLIQIGKTHVKAHHFPIESLGLIYAPISSDPKSSSVSLEFLRNFLRQNFAGNGRQQFIESIRNRKLLNEEIIMELENISNSVPRVGHRNTINGAEVKAMLTTNTRVDYYDEMVDVKYGLMIMRDSGLFDFIGTDFVDIKNKSQMNRTIADSMEKDLGAYSQPIAPDKDSIELSFDNELSHVFHIQLNDSQFIQIETNFTETSNFNKRSFGIFRIPFQLRGNTTKAANYVKRFFNGFLNQNFVNNSKNHLKSIAKNFQ